MFTIEMHSIAPFGKNQAFFKKIFGGHVFFLGGGTDTHGLNLW